MKKQLQEVITFYGETTLVFDNENHQSGRVKKSHPSEGQPFRCYLKYINSNCSVRCQNVRGDKVLYWPLWMGETLSPRTRKEVLAERKKK